MRALIPVTCLLLACGDKGDTGAPVATDPDLQISVASVDLGEVPKSGWGQQTAAVELSNQGDGDLTISSVALASGEGWAFQQELGELVLSKGGVQWVTLVFSPPGVGAWEDTLVVSSDDPDTPEATVSLTGEAVAGVLSALPESMDFGETTVTCTSSASTVLTNSGYDDLYLENLKITGAPDTVDLDDEALEYPMLLSPGDTVSVSATFTPDGWDALSGQLVAEVSGGGQTELEVPLEGSTATGAEHSGSVEMPHYDVVDVLLALDRSSSMRSIASLLQYETDTLVEPLQAKGYDLHLAWTVEDTGCINGDTTWIDGETTLEDADAIGVGMVDIYGLEHDVPDEAFTMLYAALEASESGGCAEGLVRSEASWHFVGISDDPEMSSDRWEVWKDLFLADKPEEEAFYVHGLGNDEDETCARLETYDKVIEAAEDTEGSFHLLCQDADVVMGDLAASIVERQDAVGEAGRHLALDVQADGGAMTVVVDGSETDAWTYDMEANVLSLDEQPPGGSSWSATYSALSDCP